MHKYLLGIFVSGLLVTSCAGPRPVASGVGTSAVSALDCGKGSSMAWKSFGGKALTSNVPLPRSYKVYEVTGAGDFFQLAKTGAQEVMIPLPAGCIPFKVSLSETMSPGPAGKIPATGFTAWQQQHRR